MNIKYILASDLKVIEKRFTAKPHPDLIEIPKSYSVAGGDSSYVITENNTIQDFRFGMTPHFALNQLTLLTARAEGNKNGNDDPLYNGSKAIFLQPEFKKPIFNQRCIVVADAFYAVSDNKPYLVYLQNKIRPLGLAGLYDSWENPQTKEISKGFAIITTTANPMLQSIGVKRMPVLLPVQYETNWLKPLPLSEVLRYLVQCPSEKMNAYPVSDLVNVGGYNDTSMLKPIGEKLQKESTPMPNIRSSHYHKTKPTSSEPWFKGTGKE